MSLYFKNGDTYTEIKEVQSISKADALIFKLNCIMTTQAKLDLEAELMYKLQRPCVVVDARVEKIYGVENG